MLALPCITEGSQAVGCNKKSPLVSRSCPGANDGAALAKWRELHTIAWCLGQVGSGLMHVKAIRSRGHQCKDEKPLREGLGEGPRELLREGQGPKLSQNCDERGHVRRSLRPNIVFAARHASSSDVQIRNLLLHAPFPFSQREADMP
jgi:hypothetical protein